MKKNINVVFFSDLKNITWKENIISDLNIILSNLNLKLGKTLGHEIEMRENGIQEIRTIERPSFSNDENKIELTFIEDRIDFKFEVEDTDVIEKIKYYFDYLEQITAKLELNIYRIGVNCTGNLKEIDLSNSYLPLYEPKEVINNFGIKQNIVKNLSTDNIKINILTAIEIEPKISVYLVDFNTIPNNQKLSENNRKEFLEKILSDMPLLINKIENL